MKQMKPEDFAALLSQKLEKVIKDRECMNSSVSVLLFLFHLFKICSLSALIHKKTIFDPFFLVM